MKTTFLKTTLLLFAITFFNCENNDPQDQLPPITQTGANTFGAIVNGRVFVPKDSFNFTPGGGTNNLEVNIGENFIKNKGDDKWLIKTYNAKDTPSTYIFLYLPTLKNNKTKHTIDESDGSGRSNLSNAHIYCLIDKSNRQYRSFYNSGNLEFTRLDITNSIYSGTFSVKLKNKDDENDIIEITNGRFDINLNTVNK
ncbi:hypothetical protein [Polaribacter glomeratus]|uniref:Uncharacterized protein n=1 Tax=Polaribacter glomeratus TaxID=102 RepID=A0A2S7WGZ0_9FLAO|nr:hypothetical protein [Polaribacter glomeratus]PQJ76686.1 hypothetical protein BTO16_12435 [Polaribacter glomeratus]TXD67473.1 hypothetical protein ESX12_02480 [Polaribacter glomeratus]